MDSRIVLAASLAIGLFSAVPAFPEEPASGPGGATVGDIRIVPGNIFDLEDPKENNWLFRLANRLHIRTRPSVIRRQLLFRPGDKYDSRLLAESERILRSNGYFYDAQVRPAEVSEGRVDVEVRTRDVWTLDPGVSFERKGGKNSTGVNLKEKNLLGLGTELGIAIKSTPERREQSLSVSDSHLFGTRIRAAVEFANNSDGKRRSFLLERPFYALDARWAASAVFARDDRVDTIVGVGTVAAEFRTRAENINVSGGWSRGLSKGWVWRYFLGGKRDQSRFYAVPGATAAAPVPADRVLVYPFAGVEIIQDTFETAKNRDQIERTEDFFLGLLVRATAGYSFPAFGSDRYAIPFTASVQKGAQFGDRWTVTSNATAAGRVEGGAARDTTLSAGAHVYVRLGESWLSFASVSGSREVKPDDDHQLTLGGDTGLRGYPIHYQAGVREFLVTVEQRYFSSWYPFRLFRVGAAAFFDVGRAWGGTRTGFPAPGRLRDAGVGLRIGNARSGLGNVIHVDVAFPVDGDPSIARAQILVETKSSF